MNQPVDETLDPDFDPKLAALTEVAERELCRRHLLPFMIKATPGYQAGWVHKEVCRTLEKFTKRVAFCNRNQLPGPRLMITMPPRHGKQLADSTPMLTTKGWTTHGSLKVGDYVFNQLGFATRVVAVSDKTPSDWVVTCTNGEQIRCHQNHEWLVYNRSSKIWQKLETHEMAGDYARSQYQFYPLEPLQYPKAAPLLMHPYVLGVWLGDGTQGRPCITHSADDKAMVERIHELGYRITNVSVQEKTGAHTTYFSGLRPGRKGVMQDELRQLKVEHNKHIPEPYLRASLADRLQLLAGLIDSDGYVAKDGRVTFSSTNVSLRDGVFDLCQGLGFQPYIGTYKPNPKHRIRSRKVCWRVMFRPHIKIPCILPRKQIRWQGKRQRIGIRSVARDPNGEQGHCIQVEGGVYLAGRKLIPTHNSEIASRNFPAWVLGNYPNWEIIATSYAASLALKFSRRARALVRSPFYQSVFPEIKLNPDAQSAENWLIDQRDGGYMAAGVQGPITGSGFHIGLVDDPTKNREDAESQTIRENIKDWYRSTFYTRQAPGAGIILIMTRWHNDDLAGWLLDEMNKGLGDDWYRLNYPAIATEEERYRKKGDPLHVERYPLPVLEVIKKAVGPAEWEALYQQNPTAASGLLFTRDMIKLYRDAERPAMDELTFYTAWDLAIGQNQSNDWTVGITVGVDKQDRIWVVDMQRGRWDSYDIVEKILDTFETWKPLHVGLEKGQISLAIGPHLEKRIAERGVYEFPYDEQHMLKPGRQDKVARSASIRGRMRLGKVLFPESAPWLQTLINELLQFDKGVNDDIVDSLSWVGIMLGLFVPPHIQQKDETPEWLKKVLKRTGTSHHSAMSA